MAKHILKTTQSFGSKNKTLVPDAVTYHSDWSKVSMKEKVNSSLDCLRMLVMKHFNTHNVQPRNISEPLTPKTKLSDNRFYMHCVKAISPLCKSVTEVMFWFIMYVNESIESTHRERVCFQGSNFVALFTLKILYFSSCSRFRAHIVSTVILTNYERTHKATTRQSVWNGFYWESKIQPPICAPFGTKSYLLLN